MSMYRYHYERMVNPSILIGHTVIVVAQNDTEARAKVQALSTQGVDYTYRILRIEEIIEAEK